MSAVITSSLLATIPFLLAAALGALLYCLLLIPSYMSLGGVNNAKMALQNYVFLFFASVLGLVVGVLAAHSREPAIGAVVPAVLTLMGAMVGLAYSSPGKLSTESKLTIIGSALAMVSFLLVGVFAGAELRRPWEEYARDMDRYKHELQMQHMRYQAELDKDKMLYAATLEKDAARYRAELGLAGAGKAGGVE